MDIKAVLQQQYGLSESAVALLETYVGLVEAAPLNLTAWRGHELWTRGVWDSLEILPVLGTTSGQGLDIGSGAGFPGLVLAVVRPDWAWTLLEARGRRAAFLEGTIRALGVSHVAVVAARAEEWIREVPDQRERFDVVTLRAVGGARMSLELGLPFVKVGGKLVLVKSFEGRQEVEAERAWMEELGGHLVEWRGGPLRDERGRPDQIGVVAKVQRTPLAYPRRAAKLGR